MTDGYEAGSTSDPRRSVEFARLLGVPVYVVLLEVGERSAGAPGTRLATRGLLEASPVGDLRLLTDPTGGRLIRISSASAIARAFAHIDAELRHQYVLTYYSDQPPDADERDAVSVRVPGRKDVTVRTVWALDQVN